jgi:hypothetical protein
MKKTLSSSVIGSRAGCGGLPSFFYEEVVWKRVLGININYHVRNVVAVTQYQQTQMVQAIALAVTIISKTINKKLMGIS